MRPCTILIRLEMPAPGESPRRSPGKSPGESPRKSPSESSGESRPIEERVRELIEAIESPYPSAVEWHTLSKLYKSLLERRESGCQHPKLLNLIDMIHPVMSKFGYHGVTPETRRSGDEGDR